MVGGGRREETADLAKPVVSSLSMHADSEPAFVSLSSRLDLEGSTEELLLTAPVEESDEESGPAPSSSLLDRLWSTKVVTWDADDQELDEEPVEEEVEMGSVSDVVTVPAGPIREGEGKLVRLLSRGSWSSELTRV